MLTAAISFLMGGAAALSLWTINSSVRRAAARVKEIMHDLA